MQQITYEQLHNFCEKPDTFHPKLLYPSIAGGRWYATNRRVLISVPKEYVVEDERLYDGCKIEGRYPNVKGVINEENVRATKGVDLSLIKAAFAKQTHKLIKEEAERGNNEYKEFARQLALSSVTVIFILLLVIAYLAYKLHQS